MEHYQINSFANSKVPSYVPIYDRLYSDIMNGVYENGSKLPGEAVLAEKYDVSRNTVRQALTVLVEDGLVAKVQGKGTFVTYDGNRAEEPQGLYNPMIACCRSAVDKIDIYYNFGPATEIGQRKLGLRPSEIVLAGNNVYYTGGKPVGHSFMQIPVKFIDGLNVDLNMEEDVKDLLNRQIFQMSERVQMAIKLVCAEDYITAYLKVPRETPLIFIEEIFYDKEKNAIARCKFYFLPDEYDIVFKENGM
ncbi:hypothetical protein B5F07_07345 [Lachnoclostridium sp. An169]|uniref:GntR family transcriptional regulator n=1 Tax=Lachnoclostridium sp. An169 TaxID=1965569 RepID=UPI000B37F385|nr:GntR family transcriptional regulator [Lachnoclostridium sp. An169]OUP84634.1 hypothetical protein B5F07_07345 [Lachnoclostridium sp. An169]HJA66135.1 GntR family transcriptional regulator [Candidatus Mediterraneibacter cottocaccae]